MEACIVMVAEGEEGSGEKSGKSQEKKKGEMGESTKTGAGSGGLRIAGPGTPGPYSESGAGDAT